MRVVRKGVFIDIAPDQQDLDSVTQTQESRAESPARPLIKWNTKTIFKTQKQITENNRK